jgi:hypothetical protein
MELLDWLQRVMTVVTILGTYQGTGPILFGPKLASSNLSLFGISFAPATPPRIKTVKMAGAGGGEATSISSQARSCTTSPNTLRVHGRTSLPAPGGGC